jgi:hypothetical protein
VRVLESRLKSQESHQDSRVKTQDSRVKSQESRLKSQESRVKSQDFFLSQQDSNGLKNSVIPSTDSRAGMLFQFCHRRGFVAGQSNSGNAVLNNWNLALFQIFEGHHGPTVV